MSGYSDEVTEGVGFLIEFQFFVYYTLLMRLHIISFQCAALCSG